MSELVGLTVVNTRSRAQAPELTRLLQARGASVVEAPVIEFVEPDDGGAALTDALRRLESFDWVVFTSTNTVDRVALLMDDRLEAVKVAVIGPSTERALKLFGIGVTLMPPEFVAESLVEAFPAGSGSVLVPSAQEARDVLDSGLAAKGWTVERVAAYKTVPTASDEAVRTQVGGADAITFTSASTVDAYIAAYGPEALPPLVVCIGPATAAIARKHGISSPLVATSHTVDGVVDVLVAEVIGARQR